MSSNLYDMLYMYPYEIRLKLVNVFSNLTNIIRYVAL